MTSNETRTKYLYFLSKLDELLCYNDKSGRVHHAHITRSPAVLQALARMLTSQSEVLHND